jgi:hypothetical protein
MSPGSGAIWDGMQMKTAAPLDRAEAFHNSEDKA